MPARAPPHRQRRAPVALARQRPVDVPRQPVAEAPVLDVRGMPGDLLVRGQHGVAHRGRLHVPALLRVIQERRAAPPAVRVGVLVGLGAKQPPGLPQRLHDVRIRVLHEPAGERTHPLVERPVLAHGVLDLQPEPLSQPEVVLAERHRRVDHAGPLLGRHEVGRQHRVAPLAVVGDERERRLVRDADQLRPGHPRLHLDALPEHALDKRLGQDQHLV